MAVQILLVGQFFEHAIWMIFSDWSAVYGAARKGESGRALFLFALRRPFVMINPSQASTKVLSAEREKHTS